MEKGEKRLRPGDVLIQRGTNHSWSVRGNKPCVIAAILISAKPLGIAAKAAKKGAGTAAKKPAKRAGKREAG